MTLFNIGDKITVELFNNKKYSGVIEEEEKETITIDIYGSKRLYLKEHIKHISAYEELDDGC